jgi:hypothetical protein
VEALAAKAAVALFVAGPASAYAAAVGQRLRAHPAIGQEGNGGTEATPIEVLAQSEAAVKLLPFLLQPAWEQQGVSMAIPKETAPEQCVRRGASESEGEQPRLEGLPLQWWEAFPHWKRHRRTQ